MSHADRRFGRRCARPLGTTSVKLAGDGQEAVADAHIQTEVSCEEEHVSIQTTERYLGCKQKLRCAVNDTMGLEPEPSA